MTADTTAAGRQNWRFYLQEKVLVIFLLGFSAGLPFPLVYSTVTAWLNDAGIEKSTIGAFAWVGFAYAFKVLWSPFVDRLPIPLLTAQLGRRRAWLLLSQSLVVASLLFMSQLDPAAAIGIFAITTICVAVASATQDLALDAYRIESAGDELQAPLAAAYQYGYRIAMLVGGAGALFFADFISWGFAYKAMAIFMGVGLLTTLFCKERKATVASEGPIFEGGFARWFVESIIGPFKEFLQRYGKFAVTILAFIAVFRISDYVLGILANPFYLDVGFTKSEVAAVAKLYGLWVALFGIGGGGWAVVRFGQSRSLVAAATLIAATNLFFAILAYTGPEIWALTLTISFDNFAQGFAGTVFIAYLSSLTNISFTATQYALFNFFSIFVGKSIAGFSGFVQESIGWVGFFLYAAAIGIPSIVLSIIVVRHQDTEHGE
ncbi:MAG: MFS transporter [Woeseiaceae bacterium]|nr:MFS transporter [Woeseiaceae bacterium]